MIIDFHTHIFPERLAAGAIASLSHAGGGLHPRSDGTAAGLRACLAANGAGAAVVANIAVTPHRQRSVNDFAISLLAYPELIPFGSVHPDAPDAADELYRLKEAGICGIKLHPDYQQFFSDDERAFAIYETCDRLGLVVLFHAGMDIGLPLPFRNPPERMARVLPAFPHGRVVAAHWGGYGCWADTLKYLCGKDLYFDTSYSFSHVPLAYAREILAAHPAEKLLFGTDHPWNSLSDELAYLHCITDDADTQDMILGGNAQALLGL